MLCDVAVLFLPRTLPLTTVENNPSTSPPPVFFELWDNASCRESGVTRIYMSKGGNSRRSSCTTSCIERTAREQRRAQQRRLPARKAAVLYGKSVNNTEGTSVDGIHVHFLALSIDCIDPIKTIKPSLFARLGVQGPQYSAPGAYVCSCTYPPTARWAHSKHEK